MHTPAAYGMFSSDVELRQALDTLNQSGFGKEDICMMVSPRHPIATRVREANILNAGRKENAVKESFLGWLFEFGAVFIPTLVSSYAPRLFFTPWWRRGRSLVASR